MDLNRINNLIAYLKNNSPFYKAMQNVGPVSDWEGFRRLPVTSKRDLSDQGQRFLCVGRPQIAEIVSTSGTTGKPLYISLTRRDLNRLAEIEKTNFSRAGFGPADRVQIMTTLDRLFIAGMAYYSGLSLLSSTIIRMGNGNLGAQVKAIRDLKVNALVAVPSFLIRLAEEAGAGEEWAKGIDKIVIIGENILEQNLQHNLVGGRIKALFPAAELFSSYGNTEIQGAFCECRCHQGMHINDKYYHIEILDEQQKPLHDNEIGELTVTTFGIEGMPLLRYQTGDLTFKTSIPCACGEKSVRIGPIIGRRNQMMKIKGTTTYPGIFYSALHQIKGARDFVLVAGRDQHGGDTAKIYLVTDNEASQNKILEVLNSELKFTPQIEIVGQAFIDNLRASGECRKKIFFIDQR